MENKRPNFYPNGEVIDYKLPQTFTKALKGASCGDCYLYSNKWSFCGKYMAKGVKDTYVCHSWRKRHFKR